MLRGDSELHIFSLSNGIVLVGFQFLSFQFNLFFYNTVGLIEFLKEFLCVLTLIRASMTDATEEEITR
jgi:hypothetical protein